MKTIILLLVFTFSYSLEWTEYNNSIIESKTIILKIQDYFAPKLGNEDPLNWDELKEANIAIPWLDVTYVF